MATEVPSHWVKRFGFALHVGMALPWAAEATAILLLASTGDANGPVQVAAVPAGATALALFLTRRGWLVLSALAGSLACFVGLAGIGLNYIDHSPGGSAAQFALAATYAVFVVGLVGSAAALVIGVVESRARSRPGG